MRPYILFQEWLKSGKDNIEYERNSPVWPGVTFESVKQVMLKSCLSIFTKYLVHCKPPSVSNAISAKYKSDDLGVSFIHEKSKRRLFIRCLAAFCSMGKIISTTQIMGRIYISMNFNDLANLPLLKLGHGWVTTTHAKQWIRLITHALNLSECIWNPKLVITVHANNPALDAKWC